MTSHRVKTWVSVSEYDFYFVKPKISPLLLDVIFKLFKITNIKLCTMDHCVSICVKQYKMNMTKINYLQTYLLNDNNIAYGWSFICFRFFGVHWYVKSTTRFMNSTCCRKRVLVIRCNSWIYWTMSVKTLGGI